METIMLEVTKIVRVDNECILVYLEADDGKPLSYLPGQFLTFIFDRDGREARRSYSIFTTPGIDKELAVLVKRVVNGEMSRYLIDHLAPGDRLQAIPPSGRFLLPQEYDPAEPLLFIAAGSGISPVFSIIKEALLLRSAASVSLIYQNRTESQILFANELDELKESSGGRLKITLLLSNPASHQQVAARLNNTLLEKLLQEMNVDFRQTRFYLCGPPAFMRMCQFVLHVMKVADEKIHKEIFYFESAPVARLSHSTETRTVLVNWNQRQYHFSVQYPDSILTAALRAGIKLPYSCRGGRCSTCTIRCKTGKVVMSINETLTERDLQAGLVLTCVGYPESDIELEYPF